MSAVEGCRKAPPSLLSSRAKSDLSERKITRIEGSAVVLPPRTRKPWTLPPPLIYRSSMKLNLHRVAAVIVLALVSGLYRHHNYATWTPQGRDAFIAGELKAFDSYMAHPQPVYVTLFRTLVSCAFIVGLYELIGAALLKLFPRTPVEGSTSVARL